MKTGNVPRRFVTRLNSLILVGVFIILAAAVAVPVYSGGWRASSSGISEKSVTPLNSAKAANADFLPASNSKIPAPWTSAFALPQPAPLTITTYASDCSTAKTVFNIRDTDKTVCATVTGALPGWVLIWSNSNFTAVQSVNITSDPFTNSFTLSTSSSLGDWRVIVFDPFGGTVQQVTTFTVIDAQNPSADVQVSKGPVSASTSAGSQVVFGIQVGNGGPDSATLTQLTDDVPANTTFVSFVQLSGPVFPPCTSPAVGATGTTTCSVASLAKDATATFLATYMVNGSASSGSSISNTANISSAIADSNQNNNSSTASVPVLGSPCVLTCPSNITQDADSGQAGALVTYSTPSHTGDCGQDVIDPETGNTIPAISCSPASGSFFGVGTSTVVCSAQTGTVCTFQVTINNPGGLSISLNGANPLAVECGDDFNDPGATAVDGAGHSVPVVVTLPQGFNPDAPAVGSYTLTYTATQGANSVSTTRTVNVSDTKPPDITINGSNPYKIELGTCVPFVDPGVSASDGCSGSKPVSSSISGPGGLTTIDPNTAGTYTITYTATDGTHSATATRTVLVGNFPPDEVDLGTSNGVPVIKLLGGDLETHAVSAECGMFVDPGATATTACGTPISFTVTGTFDMHTPGTYVLTYTATDGSASASVQRTVTITADNTAPTITLNGANPLTVECHGTFHDPGATAHDACAGDFAATASGSVDPNTPGTYTITYNATDPSGHAATPVTRTVNVVDTTPPTITSCPTARSANANSSCQAAVPDFTGSATATDLCGGAVTITQSPAAGTLVTVGATTVTITATDIYNNSSTCTTTFTVADVTPPTITLNGQTPSMWPPNHKYHTFGVTDFVTSVSDNCDSSIGVSSVVITKVTSDEIENGNGDGNTLNDIVIAPDCKSVQLRSEREGGGNGRVYTIYFSVSDTSGNVGTATAKVVVQHNPGETAVDSGVHYTVCCHGGTCP
jgi:uncharacterized repeat protein (TIGR01451 family)